MSNKCNLWHSQPLVNPLTNRTIKKNGPTYKKLLKECGPPPQNPQPNIYCGNNGRDEGLLNGTKVLGTRYQCFKKGIGKGLKEPILDYTPNYEPIDDYPKIFCGNGNVLPQNKDQFGTRQECLRKGFGVGQKQKYIQNGGIRRTPSIIEDQNWYRIYLPIN